MGLGVTQKVGITSRRVNQFLFTQPPSLLALEVRVIEQGVQRARSAPGRSATDPATIRRCRPRHITLVGVGVRLAPRALPSGIFCAWWQIPPASCASHPPRLQVSPPAAAGQDDAAPAGQPSAGNGADGGVHGQGGPHLLHLDKCRIEAEVDAGWLRCRQVGDTQRFPGK
jgi:hypothetical protein